MFFSFVTHKSRIATVDGDDNGKFRLEMVDLALGQCLEPACIFPMNIRYRQLSVRGQTNLIFL